MCEMQESTLNAKFVVVQAALQALCAALPADNAAAVVNQLRALLATDAVTHPNDAIDEAQAGVLAPLVRALAR